MFTKRKFSFVAVVALAIFFCGQKAIGQESFYRWSALEPIPDSLGVAGPFAGVHKDVLIVGGGANFPEPIWDDDTKKQWLNKIYVLTEPKASNWIEAGSLPRPVAYGAAVSTKFGILCMGGNDAENVFRSVYLIRWNKSEQKVTLLKMADLPKPCAFGSATLVGNQVFLAGGLSGQKLESAMKNFWRLDLPEDEKASDSKLAGLKWNVLDNFAGPARAFNITVAQHNGFNNAIHVISGRRQNGDEVEFLKDNWVYDLKSKKWRQRKDVPQCVMAGAGIAVGQSHIFVSGGADGKNFHKSAELKNDHPGFPKEAWQYHTITNTWVSAGETPANHVTTIAVKWKGKIIIPSGEIRPRVRSPKVWQIEVSSKQLGFGIINYSVLGIYLAGIVGIGIWFARRNRNTDQYFRGGKSIPWWAAGCSIFATMLSSLTYTGVPSKAFAQDWVYAIGNFMIPVVAFVAVFVALPFFRQIDATSAYEYLEKRFNRGVRLFGSASFTVFHIFRMAVVMSLTALALAVATPLTPVQSVLLMGALSILYCTMGGIEAVIWTDTIQTFVLLGGALVAVFILINGIDGGWSGFMSAGSEAGKFNFANLHLDPTDAQIALWVIVVGGIGQNISSYTSDQAVVQRYMTTADQKLAARSIWTNAILTIPATFIFFGIGTALFVFYQNHPERLDPTANTDQVFPAFIAYEMPVGLAGLLVAGIFAAAQSTVSTSMNSTATTIVTDFLKPFNLLKNDQQYLVAAWTFTVLIGLAGTGFALLFVSPDIKSLFDQFIKVIGLFMGVLGGLFVLGVMTRRANGVGALVGAFVGAFSMFYLWKETKINGYLYTVSGITICFLVGYAVSLVAGKPPKSIDGLTVYDMNATEFADDTKVPPAKKASKP